MINVAQQMVNIATIINVHHDCHIKLFLDKHQLLFRDVVLGSHNVMSWDDRHNLGSYVPHVSEPTFRGGYRQLTQPGSSGGTADRLRMMHYHGLGNIAAPSCISEFFIAAPTEYG